MPTGLVTPYDFEIGFDPSSANAITLTQLLQAINQIVPLSYIGGVVAGNSATAAGIPDPVTYPRLTKYIFLDFITDPPTPKYWKVGATTGWTAVTVAALSLTNAQISATADIEITKLLKGSARQVLATDLAGATTAWLGLAQLLNTGDVGLNIIEVASAPGQAAPAVNYLTQNPNQPLTSWRAPLFSDFPAATQLTLAQLGAGGASINDRVRFNGSSWVVNTPFNGLSSDASKVIAVQNGGNPSITANLTTQFVHGLGALPRFVRVVGVCVGTGAGDGGYSVNDEVEITTFMTHTNLRPVFHVRSNSTYVEVGVKGDDGGIYVMGKATYAVIDIAAAMWKYKVYASM